MTAKTCFVVMGFGEKTDYQTQRTLNLDKTYHGIIRPAVEESDLNCIRADDMIHAGVIDKPMYEQLLKADLVIADLSTSNPNAIYELGVRHALCPNTTIVIAESQFSFPFDLSHVVIRSYEHLGKGIDFEEVAKMKTALKQAIAHLVGNDDEIDSPVYTFMPDLKQPVRSSDAVEEPGFSIQDQQNDSDTELFSALLEKAQNAREQSNFELAKALFADLHQSKVNDSYIAQQLALATYKCGGDDDDSKLDALNEARQIIQQNLKPETTNDPETLGLWGAIHKRIWELNKNRSDLDTSVWAYERGYYLKRDYYNGINYAFVLNLRSLQQQDEEEKIADKILAKRVRLQVKDLVDVAVKQLPKDENNQPVDKEEAYWVAATKLEALVGVGEDDQFNEESERIFAQAPEQWMIESTEAQIKSLKSML